MTTLLDKTYEEKIQEELEIMKAFLRNRLKIKDLPQDEKRLKDLVREIFYSEMRTEEDAILSISSHRCSHREDTMNLFLHLNKLTPQANSFLDLGAGSGYVLRCALRVNYYAAGVEITPYYANIAKELLTRFNYDPNRIIEADFLKEAFKDKDLAGKTLKEYDLVHLWPVQKVVFQALPKILPEMKSGAILITAFENPFDEKEITDYLNARKLSAKVVSYNCRGNFFIQRD